MTTAAKSIALFALLATAACDSSSDPIVDGCQPEGRYFPLDEGRTWTYSTTELDSGQREVKTQTVGELESLDGDKAGIEAFQLTTEKAGGTVISWQEDTGSSILRHLEHDLAGSTQTEELYNPYKVRIDESADRIVLGATWTDAYTEEVRDMGTGAMTMASKTETWVVEAIDEQVEVPAGTFCAMRVNRVSRAVTSGSNKTYWFARGVGKVRESGVSRTEDLVSFTE